MSACVSACLRECGSLAHLKRLTEARCLISRTRALTHALSVTTHLKRGGGLVEDHYRAVGAAVVRAGHGVVALLPDLDTDMHTDTDTDKDTGTVSARWSRRGSAPCPDLRHCGCSQWVQSVGAVGGCSSVDAV